MVSLIAFIIFSALLLTMFKKNSDPFSPIRLFSLLWLLVVGLTALRLSRFQRDWSSYSWWILLLALFAFLTGAAVVYFSFFGREIKTIDKIRKDFKNYIVDENLLFRVIIIVFILYVVSYLVNYLMVGFLPLFTKRPAEARTLWGVFGFSLLIHLPPAIVLLITQFYLFVKGALFRKTVLGLVLIVTLFTYLFLLQRFDIVFAVIIALVFTYYATNKFKLRHVLGFIAVIILIIVGISTMRAASYVSNFLYYLSDMKFSVKYAFFTEPYMYIAMNLENFMSGVNGLDNFEYGYNTFNPVLSLTGLKHWLNEYMNIAQYPHMVTNTYNTYSLFFDYYKDFGPMGIGIFSFILGALISGSYWKMRINPNIHSISVYGIFVFVILFSFFVNMLGWLHFVFNAAAIYFVTKFILIRGTKADPNS